MLTEPLESVCIAHKLKIYLKKTFITKVSLVFVKFLNTSSWITSSGSRLYLHISLWSCCSVCTCKTFGLSPQPIQTTDLICNVLDSGDCIALLVDSPLKPLFKFQSLVCKYCFSPFCKLSQICLIKTKV